MAPTVPIEFCGQKQSMMGKSRKYSKGGQLSGFVPDYRHAVETMGESEGFGSSGRVDAEMTASEDSCAPSKMKCISLNGDDSFGVSMQVLQLSRLSRTERKDLERKLHSELEQVRDLQKRIAAINSAVVISPSSDIRSCSDGKARPPVDAYPRPAAPAQVGKKRPPPAGRNGARNKKPGGVETTRPVAASNAQLMKQCEVLLNQLMKHGYAWVFQKPVDVVQLNIPDYFTVIKHPMDLGTVKSKLTSGGYSSPLAFAADVRLTFSNAMTYNPPENDVHIMAQTLSKDFEKRWKAIEKKLPVTGDVQSLPVIHTEVIETPAPMPPSKKKKTTQDETSFKPVKPAKPEPLKRIMTDEERQKLTMEVDSLLDELPDNILDFLKEHSGEGQTSGEEIEIDFEVLSHDTLFALRKLLDDYLLEKEKTRAKAEPCEMEILHEPGFSNSSMQPCKGNDLVDEDVDVVGGNDAPMSSFPPVEIEKDAAQKNSKCSSSSSSSSDSGSSSSGSDSASSSDSELRVPKALPAFGGGKGNFDSGANSGEKRNDIGDSEIANDPRNGVVPVEQKSLSKPVSVEEGERHEEESAPPERQVSPEKLYRAAVLRNRFADTIFKAKEKALEKGDKLDPEKLRIEREELERRRKEEKARLQAEARAAEEARKKAEASAAAEARRLRELEREAARQALQMMEKTVDINENHFMEDLEMFRAVQDDHLSHFVEETSPEHSPNELGSFKLPGISNPLEKLGLFMKADDMEIEEEVSEPTLADNVEEVANDNEEEPANIVKEGPANDYEEGPANDVTEGPANDFEEGPANDVIERPANDYEEGPANDVIERPANDYEEGPSNDVKEGPANDFEEGPANDVKEGPANDFEEGHVKEGSANDFEEGHVKEGSANAANVVKEDHDEGPASDVVEGHEEGPSNNEGHEDGPANDVVEGSSEDVDGIATEVEEGIVTEVEGIATEVGEEIANDVGEGLSNDVRERLSNDVGEGSANGGVVEGIANDVGEGLANDDKGIANDVEERPRNDVEEEPRNDDEGGMANDVGEGLTNGGEGMVDHVEEGPRNYDEEEPQHDSDKEGLAGMVDHIEEGPRNDDEEEPQHDSGKECLAGMVDHVEEGPRNDDEEEPQHDSGKEGLANDASQGSADHVEERTAADVDVEDTEDIEID